MTTILVEPFAPWLRELSQASVQTPERSGPFVPPADLRCAIRSRGRRVLVGL